jgi:hypothetical protein
VIINRFWLHVVEILHIHVADVLIVVKSKSYDAWNGSMLKKKKKTSLKSNNSTFIHNVSNDNINEWDYDYMQSKTLVLTAFDCVSVQSKNLNANAIAI